MRSEVCVPDIIVPFVGGKTQYGRESNETKDGWNSFQNSEDMDVEDTKNVIVKNTCFSHSDLIIPETYRGGKADTTAGKDSLEKSTCYTGSVNTRISSSLKSSQAEKYTLEVNDIQVILPERDQWIDQERIDSMKRFVGKLPFNLSPDISKTSENSLIEKKLIRNFHELLLPKVKPEVKSMTERCKTMQSTPVKRELLTMNEDSCIFLKISNNKVTDLTLKGPSDQNSFALFNQNESRMTKDDLSSLRSHLRKSYGKNINQEDIFLIMEVHRQIGDNWSVIEAVFPPLSGKKIQNIIRAGKHLQISRSSSIEEDNKLQVIAKKKIERYLKEKEYNYKDFISPEKSKSSEYAIQVSQSEGNKDISLRNNIQFSYFPKKTPSIEKLPKQQALILPNYNSLGLSENNSATEVLGELLSLLHNHQQSMVQGSQADQKLSDYLETEYSIGKRAPSHLIGEHKATCDRSVARKLNF